jgi:hypothetical protein
VPGGQGNATVFETPDAVIQWHASTVADVADEEDPVGVGSYLVRVLVEGKTVREREVTSPRFRYALADNRLDNAGAPSPDLTFEVYARTAAGRLSGPARLAVSNPRPSLADMTPTVAAILNGIDIDWSTYVEPEDLAGYDVLADTTDPPSTLRAHVPAGQRRVALHLDPALTWFVRVRPVDVFGSGTPSSSASILPRVGAVQVVVNVQTYGPPAGVEQFILQPLGGIGLDVVDDELDCLTDDGRWFEVRRSGELATEPSTKFSGWTVFGASQDDTGDLHAFLYKTSTREIAYGRLSKDGTVEQTPTVRWSTRDILSGGDIYARGSSVYWIWSDRFVLYLARTDLTGAVTLAPTVIRAPLPNWVQGGNTFRDAGVRQLRLTVATDGTCHVAGVRMVERATGDPPTSEFDLFEEFIAHLSCTASGAGLTATRDWVQRPVTGWSPYALLVLELDERNQLLLVVWTQGLAHRAFSVMRAAADGRLLQGLTPVLDPRQHLSTVPRYAVGRYDARDDALYLVWFREVGVDLHSYRTARLRVSA